MKLFLSTINNSSIFFTETHNNLLINTQTHTHVKICKRMCETAWRLITGSPQIWGKLCRSPAQAEFAGNWRLQVCPAGSPCWATTWRCRWSRWSSSGLFGWLRGAWCTLNPAPSFRLRSESGGRMRKMKKLKLRTRINWCVASFDWTRRRGEVKRGEERRGGLA